QPPGSLDCGIALAGNEAVDPHGAIERCRPAGKIHRLEGLRGRGHVVRMQADVACRDGYADGGAEAAIKPEGKNARQLCRALSDLDCRIRERELAVLGGPGNVEDRTRNRKIVLADPQIEAGEVDLEA